MTVQEALAGSDIAKSDAEVLLSWILQRDRSWLLAHEGDVLEGECAERWNRALERRRAGEPVAYIIGEREFCGRSFAVNGRVLIPRPCTEKLVEAVKRFLSKPRKHVENIDVDIVAWTEVFDAKTTPQAIVDVGTGSGCIAVTLACDIPEMKIFALDIDPDALNVARENARRHGVEGRIVFLQSDLLSALPEDVPPYLVVSNPPYLDEQGEAVQVDVRSWEPRVALFAEEKGGALTKKLMDQAHADRMCVGIVMETQEQFAR